MDRTISRSARVILATALALTACLSVLEEVSRAEVSKDSDEPPGDQSGSSLEVDPRITIYLGYADNIFSTRNDKVSDGIVIFAPDLNASWKHDRFSLNVSAQGEFGRHIGEQSEDYDDYKFGSNGEYRFVNGSRVFGGATFSHDHEERQSPDDVNGIEPTVYQDLQAYAGYARKFGSVITRTGVTFERVNFDDVPGEFGSINNDDRDRDQLEAGTRLGLAISSGRTIFLQGEIGSRNYDDNLDDYGIDRDSSGYDLLLGYTWRKGRLTKAEVALGLLSQDYDDPSFEEVEVFDFSGALEWSPVAGSRISGLASRTLLETTLPSSPGILESRIRAAFDQQINSALSLGGSITMIRDDYVDNARRDNTSLISVNGHYKLSDLAFWGAKFSHAQRDSNDPHSDYDDNRIFVYLGSQLNSSVVTASTVPDVASSSGTMRGFYGGVEGMVSGVHTELEGPRGAGGTLTSDFGDHGPGGGLFAGYGVHFGDWYLALELDGTASDAPWDHANLPDGRVFSVKSEQSYGIANLFGYTTDGGLIYGRAGYQYGIFDTHYVHEDTVIAQQDELGGFRIGMGGEVRTSESSFVRLDFSRVAYQDYDIDLDSGFDNFANSVSDVRLGFGYRVGPSGPQGREPSPQSTEWDMTGLYAGLQVGTATLGSHIMGPRSGGKTLLAEYADDGGIARGFAGYERAVGDVFFALELEADTGNVSPQLERSPTGRDISILHDGSFGAAVRLGYRFSHGGLVFLRAGIVETRFRTEYSVAHGPVDQDNKQQGIRFGIGLELPIARKVTVRIGTTYTDYEDYKLEYGASSVDRFDNDETQFLIGLAYHF